MSKTEFLRLRMWYLCGGSRRGQWDIHLDLGGLQQGLRAQLLLWGPAEVTGGARIRRHQEEAAVDMVTVHIFMVSFLPALSRTTRKLGSAEMQVQSFLWASLSFCSHKKKASTFLVMGKQLFRDLAIQS